MKQWMRRACALALAVATAAVLAQDGPSVYGKRLLQASEVPAEALARFAQHDAKMRAKGLKPGLMTGGSEDWSAAELPAPPAGNPYRVVVHVSGTALADGDARSLWMAGWRDGSGMRAFPVTGTTKAGAKAGERIELVGAASPVSFKEEGARLPALAFLGTDNLRIDQVRLEVWGGVGKSSFVESIGAWSPLLVGVVFLGLFFWFRGRR